LVFVGKFLSCFFFSLQVKSSNDIVGEAPVSINGIDPLYPVGEEVFQTLRGVYTFSIVTMFITALGNRPQGSKWLYFWISLFFSIIMAMMLFMGAWAIKIQIDLYNTSLVQTERTAFATFNYLRTTPKFRDMFVSVASTYGLYLLCSIIHLDPWHCITSMVQYLLILPTYNNMFMIYSFCNLHDVSWGTKGNRQF
jgi:chitin synthase